MSSIAFAQGTENSTSVIRNIESVKHNLLATGEGLRYWKAAFFIALLWTATTVAASTVIYKQVLHFNGTNGGDSASLIQGVDGNLYGTTKNGGAHNGWTVFKITPSGTLTTLYSFCANNCLDGAAPVAALVLATDGNFYGTTLLGGAKGWGEVFKITPAGALTILHSFCTVTCSDGGNPTAPLIQGTDGNFYGTTTVQGANFEGGTVFKITPGGKFTTLHSFCSDKCLDGAGPAGALIEGSDGNFYGATVGGGSGSEGTTFKMTPSGVVTTLHNFCVESCADGGSPDGITLASDGNFYGITAGGGADQFGTAFKMTGDGTITTLYNFCSEPHCADGQLPASTLIEGTDGDFYGTALDGGANQLGTVYTMTPGGAFTTLHNFKGKFSGAYPAVPLFQATNGIFYGTTSEGGLGGIIFTIDVGLGPFVETVPASAKVGKTVTILGRGFTGTTGVSFGGIAASYTVVSDTYLTAKVPKGATTASITVVTPAGTLTSNQAFVVLP